MRELKSVVKESFSLLPRKDLRKIQLYMPIYMSLGLLDLFGVILLGTVATLGFSSFTNDSKPTKLEIILSNLMPSTVSRTSLIVILTTFAIIFLAMKTIFQALLDLKFTRIAARIEADIASNLYSSILDGQISDINGNKYSDYHYAIVVGTNRLVAGIIIPTMNFFSDFFTTGIMLCFAIYASPGATGIVLIVFLVAYLSFNGPITRKAKKYGQLGATSYISMSENLQESLRGIREIRIYNKTNLYKDKFRASKSQASAINQQVLWMNGLIRYILELSILFSGSLVAIVLFFTQDLRRTITITTVFLLIGFRLIPTIQRLQNAINSVKISRESTRSLFTFIDQFSVNARLNQTPEKLSYRDFTEIIGNNVTYEIENGPKILDSISFRLKKNETLAILGESGAGKSTLIDLVLGLYKPSSGEISFKNNFNTSDCSASNFEISFISQNCALLGSDLYQNIALTPEVTLSQKKQIDLIIKDLGLENLLSPEARSSREIRSDSTDVSGGEKQRISIARAKYFDRDIVVLDEPTSALDFDNENRVIQYLAEVQHRKTIILVTHNAGLLAVSDKVMVLEKGKIVFFGTTDEYFYRKSTI